MMETCLNPKMKPSLRRCRHLDAIHIVEIYDTSVMRCLLSHAFTLHLDCTLADLRACSHHDDCMQPISAMISY